MRDQTKLAGAALGGYVLGRTKKGKAAIRLAMWLSGDQGQRVVAYTRNGITTLVASEMGQQLIGNVREQATSRTKALTSGLTDNLTERTKALGSVGSTATDTVGKVTGRSEDEPQDEPQDEPEQPEPEQQQPQPDTEDDNNDDNDEDDGQDRRAELKSMGVRALRKEAERYYEADDIKGAKKGDLVDWIIEAEENENDG